MAEITIETDWGAKGAQLTGEQVQAFIKGMFVKLMDKDSEIDLELTRVKAENSRQDNQLTTLSSDAASIGARMTAAEQKASEEAAKVQTLSDAQTDLSERVLSLETGIDRDEVNGAVGKIDTLIDKDEELEGRIEALSQQNTSLQNLVSSMQRDNASVQTELASLNTAIENVKSSTPPLGCAKISSLSLVPVEKNLYVAEVNVNQSFSLKSIPTAGREVHVLVRNTGSEKITILLPTNGGYYSDAETFSIQPGKNGEINAISDGATVYLQSK